MDNVFISVTKEERHKVLVSDRGSCVVSVASWQGMTLPHTRSFLCLLIKHLYHLHVGTSKRTRGPDFDIFQSYTHTLAG